VAKERSQQSLKISSPQAIKDDNVKGNRVDASRNVSTSGDYHVQCEESTALHHGTRVTQSSRSAEGHLKGDFEYGVNGHFTSEETKRRVLGGFRNSDRRDLSGPEGCNGQLLEPGNPVISAVNSTVLKIKTASLSSDLEDRKDKLHEAERKTEIRAVTQDVRPQERLRVLKPKDGEGNTVASNVVTAKPQEQETVSFPQRNEERVIEKKESNDHRQQTRTVQEVQNRYTSSQHTIVFTGSDKYGSAQTAAEQEDILVNKTAVPMKQNTDNEETQQKTRRYSPKMLPTGQHKHESSSLAASDSRNTVLLIDNSPHKKENLASMSQKQPKDNKDLIVNGIVPSSRSPLVENLIVELRESSQLQTHQNNKQIATKDIQNGINNTGNIEIIESLYKKTAMPRIQHSDWFEVDNGKPVRFSSCHITLDDSYTASSDSSNTDSSSSTMDLSRSNSFQYTDCSELNVDFDLDYRRTQLMSQRHLNRTRNMASLQGLPPLPKSLSGINLFENCGGNLHFSSMDHQQQHKPEVSTHRAVTKSGSFRQLSSQNPPASGSVGGGSSVVGSNNGSVRVVASASGRGPTPPTPGGTPHQQILHHQHVRSLQQNGDGPPPPIAPRVRKPTGLDAQLAVLRKEMVSTR
jgi:hypothetical protein